MAQDVLLAPRSAAVAHLDRAPAYLRGRTEPKQTEPEESWRPIPRAPGYQASSLGRIRRVGHEPIKPRLTRKGREIVDVRADGRPSRTIEVHVLVADAFLGPRPPGLTIDHLDTDFANNASGNLEYVTNLVNQQRRWARAQAGDRQIARAA